MKLKDDNTKWYVVRLWEEGNSNREISKLTGVSKSAVQEFLSGKTHKDWWENRYSSDDNESDDGFKMVFLDLEVAPAKVLAFNMFKHFSSPDHIVQFPYVLTAAWNWLHDDENEIFSIALSDCESFSKDVTDDYEIIVELWNVLDQADVVVAQNARFDVGWFSQQCAKHGLPEPSPYRVICTLKNSKGNFSLPSNSLGYVVKYFNLEHHKLKHDGIELWKRCMDGEVKAFEEMLVYNRGDIPTLRNLYLTTRAHIEKHPNLSIYFNDDKQRCPVCGGENLVDLTGKFAYTNLSKFDSVRCNDCGTVKRKSTALTDSVKRKKFLRNVIK